MKTEAWQATMTTFEPKAVKARIADLNVLMHCKTAFMVQRMQKYAFDFDEPAHVEIDISEQQLSDYTALHPHLDYASAEYMLSGAYFYGCLYRNYRGIMLHASAIAMDGYGYLFSANSGTGKSTHTGLWIKQFDKRAQYINDDKPALRLTEEGWRVYGTPWSGKTALNENISVPLKAIAFLYRSAENKIERMENTQSIMHFMEQTIRPKTEKGIDKVFALLEDLLENVPVYQLGCNVSPEAAKLAYETMKQ